MEATVSSETSVNFCLTARRHVRTSDTIACTSSRFIRLCALQTRQARKVYLHELRRDGNLRKIRLEKETEPSLCPSGVGFESRPRHGWTGRSSWNLPQIVEHFRREGATLLPGGIDAEATGRLADGAQQKVNQSIAQCV
jgi:hypothetical protein